MALDAVAKAGCVQEAERRSIGGDGAGRSKDTKRVSSHVVREDLVAYEAEVAARVKNHIDRWAQDLESMESGFEINGFKVWEMRAFAVEADCCLQRERVALLAVEKVEDLQEAWRGKA